YAPFIPVGVCSAEEAPSGLVSLLQSTGKQPHVFLVKMGTKQSRLRRKDEKLPSELLGWRKRRTDDNAPSEKEKEGAAHAVGQAATPSPGKTANSSVFEKEEVEGAAHVVGQAATPSPDHFTEIEMGNNISPR
ncbi:hypothetical protein GBAR_LOCUS19121, partial [Geodia barretti]